jgi:hypothetical protein
MDEVFDKFKGLKDKFPGFWLIIGAIISLANMPEQHLQDYI